MTRPTICFDLRCLQIGHESRGIGMHVRSILENLDPTIDFDYVFYAFDKFDPVKDLSINMRVPYTIIYTKTLSMSISRPRDILHLSKLVLHKFRPLDTITYDFFIQFDLMLGLPRHTKAKKNILVAYDLIPLLFRAEYMPSPHEAIHTTGGGVGSKLKSAVRSIYYTGRYRLHYDNFHKADIILSISNNTTLSLIDKLHIPASKIITIPLAPVINSTTPIAPSTTLPDKFIFYIGATDARKRVQDLIEAFNTVRDSGVDISLVLVGKEFAEPKEIPSAPILQAINNSPYKRNITFLGFVSDSEKLWLYQHAIAFVFPSMYEGFGLPILEAMQSGCVAICYRNSSIPEIAGNAAIMVDTGDITTLAKVIRKTATNMQYRTTLEKLGVTHSRNFSWDSYMTNFYSIFQKEGIE